MTRLARALPLLGLLATPILARGETDAVPGAPLAFINKIVVEGEDRQEASDLEVRVTRARTGIRVPAHTALQLFEDDEVVTGPSVSVVLGLLGDVPEQTAVVGGATQLRVRSKASLFLVLGRILSNVRGLFEVERPDGVLGAHGTEFEVVAGDDGSTRVLVLEGTVEATGRGEGPPAAESPAPGGIRVSVDSGRVATSSLSITVRNGCDEEHVHVVRSPERLAWVSLMGERFAVPGKGKRTVAHTLTLDASRVRPGTYRESVLVECLDCAAEPRCSIPPAPIPLEVTVRGGRNEAARDPGGSPPFAGRAGPLEELSLSAGRPADSPRKAAEASVRATIDWSSDVLLTGRPAYVRRGSPPYVESRPERDRAFKEARFEAVWSHGAAAYETLGKLYDDWGEGTRALEAYVRAGQANPARAATPAYLTGVAEAHRLKGRFDEAEEQLRRVLNLDAHEPRALLTLGNLRLDQAAVAGDRGDPARAREMLSAAARAFDEAASRSSERSVVAVARANRGETSLAWGHLALGEKRADEARAHFEAAQKAFAAAFEIHRPYPYSDAGRADALRGQYNAARVRGDEGAADLYLRQAEEGYARALKEGRGSFAAWTGLGALYRDAGRDDRAIDAFARAAESKSDEPLAYWRLGVALARTQPTRAAELMQTYLALEAPVFKQGLRGRTAEAIGAGKAITPPPTNPPPPPPPAAATRLVKVPGVEGDREDDAVRKLKESGLVPHVQTEASCEKPGRVLGQEPTKNTSVPMGSAVTLHVSGVGPRPIEVPPVERMTREVAEATLRRRGLAVGRVRTRRTDAVEAGTVVDQDPEARQALAPGCPVDLTVAESLPPAIVPDLRGTPEKDLQGFGRQAALALAGLTLGRIEGGGTGGVVVDQDPKPGARVPRGTPVNVRIGAKNGPEHGGGGQGTHPVDPSVVLATVPDVVGAALKTAASRVRDAGFVAAVKGKGPCVARQDPESPRGATRARRGSTVTLYAGDCPIG